MLTGCSAREPVASAPGPRTAESAPSVRAAPSQTIKADADAPRAVVSPRTPYRSAEPVDIWIHGGLIADGTGSRPELADVVIDGDRIAHVGDVDPSLVARKRIDATGRVVAPGFIDAHSHTDSSSDARHGFAMGITTHCIGQDGVSPKGGVSGLVAAANQRPPAANFAPFVGHATVRIAAGVGSRENVTRADLDKMRALIDRAMLEGAFGLSTGLEYAPGRVAKTSELVELARAVAAHDGLVMSHLRSEDDDAIDAALDELVAQGSDAGARVHVAHIKVVYGKGEARAEQLLARMDAARASGVTLTADAYPYEASFTGIDIVFPSWAKPPASYATAKATRLAELRNYLRARVTKRGGPAATVFASGRYAGLSLEAASKRERQLFEDVLIGLGPKGASAAFFVMDPKTQARLVRDPFVMLSTDGGAQSSHPRAYGAFARVLATFVRDNALLTVEEAVRKMSGLPAKTLGIDDERGLLRAGYFADVTVFNLAQVRDAATYERPRELATGFETVIVNGVLVRDAGVWTGKRAGRVLTHRARTAR